jgi:hypothetical protein
MDSFYYYDVHKWLFEVLTKNQQPTGEQIHVILVGNTLITDMLFLCPINGNILGMLLGILLFTWHPL